MVRVLSSKPFALIDLPSAILKFRTILALKAGKANDLAILISNRYLKAQFEADMRNFLILGDSGYGLSRYLMTLIRNPNTATERLYNESHIRSKTKIECAIGIWKRNISNSGCSYKITF